MDFPRDSEFAADLSPLAWVQEELRRSLGASRKALRRHLRDADAFLALGEPGQGNAPDSAGLTVALRHLHQAAGVLALVEQAACATVLRACEDALQSLLAQPQRITRDVVDTLERADFAVLDYVARQLTGRPVASLNLFPQYLAVKAVAGLERAHPADLWTHAWSWTDLPAQGAAPRKPEMAHARFERSLLQLMRHGSANEARVLSDLCASLGAGASQGSRRTPWPLWHLAAGFFEAQAGGLLPIDAYSKRIGSRLLAQLRPGVEAESAVSERLARDLLFFCAQSAPPPSPSASPRLHAVREAFGLTAYAPTDYQEVRLGQVDPAWVAQAHKRVSAAKDAWSSVADGDLERLVGLDELFALVTESLQLLFPGGGVLGQSLQRAVVSAARAEAAPSSGLAMEVATSMLYLDAVLEDATFDAPELAERVRRLAQRVEAVAHGDPPQPLDAWMEDVYRRVSDRQTMGSVVHELRGTLSATEKLVDEYFRDTRRREVLIPVPGQLSAMRGVLAVLGMEHAAQALLRMRNEVDELADTEIDASRRAPLKIFERLAANLGALGFLIDMLSVQPQLAKRLFSFDDASGVLSPVMGRVASFTSGFTGLDELMPGLVAGVASEPDLDEPAGSADLQSGAVLEPIAPQALTTDAPQAAQLDLTGADEAPAPLTAVSAAEPEVDADMLGVFLEECQDVIAAARAALEQLRGDAGDEPAVTTVRRSFHTLKGSSRMVGLHDFGEAAWACEQLYSARLGGQHAADAPLLNFSAEALDYFADWSEAILQGHEAGHQSASLRRAADALRLESRLEPIEWPQAPLTIPSEIDALAALDLQLMADAGSDAAAEPELDLQALPEPDELAGFELEFDLGAPIVPMIVVPPSDEISPLVLEGEAPPHLELVYSAAALAASVEREQALAEEAEAVKVIGPLRISISLFNIFLNEADELSRRLCIELAEWALELSQALPDSAVALAHSLAGNAATVGFDDLSRLARLLEHALERTHALRRGTLDEGQLFVDAADEIRRLLHQFAAGFLKQPDAALNQRLIEHEHLVAGRLQDLALHEPESVDSAGAPLGASPGPVTKAGELGQVSSGPLPPASEVPVPAGRGHAHDELDLTDLDAVDAIDAELFPFFEEEGKELLQQLAQSLRDWHAQPAETGQTAACMRDLHTLKGGARLCGAMRLGEMAHRMESVIQSLLSDDQATQDDIERLQNHLDLMVAEFEALRHPAADVPTEPVVVAEAAPVVPDPLPAAAQPQAAQPEAAEPMAPPAATPVPIDWSRFTTGHPAVPTAPGPGERAAGAPQHGQVRVRAPLLERLINEAGEVSIRRSRMESEVGQMKGSMADLSDNLGRLRQQLRDMEFQANAQIGSRLESAKQANQDFDPLEFDRYTRMQELTHIMAESVGDLATVQRALQRALQSTEDELAAQARLTRDLQDDLLSTRMVEFDSLSDRLYRVLRQAAKESGKQVRLDVQGGSIEVDRGVLERMTPAFEHLLRNSVIHGIESPAQRGASGKDASGTVTVTVTHEDNEVVVEFRDDGAGLDLALIRQRGVAMGVLTPDADPTQTELIQLIFRSGFSTASSLTESAGRGVGMDVVRNDVNAMGGRIVSASTPGLGTSFKLLLPLTTAVTQVVMLSCADNVLAVPATLIETVKRVSPDELEAAYQSGSFTEDNEALPFFWLGGLLQQGEQGVPPPGRTQPLVIVKSAQQRVALHVDEVLGKQEVVVKNLGPQLVRVPGLAGITLLASGAAALIYNPVALATLYGEQARKQTELALQTRQPLAQRVAPQLAPLVMVVDDSLTVRRVTQRLLEREGYRVMLSKDGLDAIEQLANELPALVLSDIEMPHMDGFDLVRNMRADARLRDLPVIMITSRIAQKHRDYAAELGVQHYLGKPYDEAELLALIARYTLTEQ